MIMSGLTQWLSKWLFFGWMKKQPETVVIGRLARVLDFRAEPMPLSSDGREEWVGEVLAPTIFDYHCDGLTECEIVMPAWWKPLAEYPSRLQGSRYLLKRNAGVYLIIDHCFKDLETDQILTVVTRIFVQRLDAPIMNDTTQWHVPGPARNCACLHVWQ